MWATRLRRPHVHRLNGKAELTMRKAYRFRAFQVTKIALYHALGKLPEPNATHKFYGGTILFET